MKTYETTQTKDITKKWHKYSNVTIKYSNRNKNQKLSNCYIKS